MTAVVSIALGFFVSFQAFAGASPTLKLDLEQSGITYGEKTFRFKSGDFKIKKGKVVGGTLILDVKGAPFINSDRYPTAQFKLKHWQEFHSFAPGAPNLEVSGLLTVNGRTHPVRTRVDYLPDERGFQASGKAEFGKKNTLLHGEVSLKIVVHRT